MNCAVSIWRERHWWVLKINYRGGTGLALFETKGDAMREVRAWAAFWDEVHV